MASSKARGEREPEAYPQGYVEDSVEPRTTLGGIFTIRYRSRAMTARHTSRLFRVCAMMPGRRLPVFS